MYRAKFDDPTGQRFGIPTFNYFCAPSGLFTRRQLAVKGLTPGRQDIAAQILWRKGKRVAYLYKEAMSRKKRAATKAQLKALAKARIALSTCPTCEEVYEYYIPKRLGECFECHYEYMANVGIDRHV